VKKTTDDDDVIAELARSQDFPAGDEASDRPLDVLRARGMDIPDEASLDDAAVTRKLWELIEGMAAIGMELESTDHLSDRELYRYLVTDGLLEEAILGGGWHLSPIGSGSDEDSEIYLRYYADDAERAHWEKSFGGPLPPKEPKPYDRDRLLQTQTFPLDSEVQ
jgi:hypothetical protein